MRNTAPIKLTIRSAKGSSDGPEILIYDEIGPTWAGMVSGESVKRALSEVANEPAVTVRINSPGGDVFEGFAIYNALQNFAGEVNIEIDALAASAASLVAMAGKRVRMAENSMMMIHNCWCMVAGNADSLEAQASVCRKVDGNLRQTYSARSGQSIGAIGDMLDAETWLTADEAIALGLADEIGQPLNVVAAVSSRFGFRNVPERFVSTLEKPVHEQSTSERSRAIRERHQNIKQYLAALPVRDYEPVERKSGIVFPNDHTSSWRRAI